MHMYMYMYMYINAAVDIVCFCCFLESSTHTQPTHCVYCMSHSSGGWWQCAGLGGGGTVGPAVQTGLSALPCGHCHTLPRRHHSAQVSPAGGVCCRSPFSWPQD